jgi:hypothetical protein
MPLSMRLNMNRCSTSVRLAIDLSPDAPRRRLAGRPIHDDWAMTRRRPAARRAREELAILRERGLDQSIQHVVFGVINDARVEHERVAIRLL